MDNCLFDDCKKKEWLKRRKLRIEQVRNQSRDVAREVRERTADERQRHQQEIKKLQEQTFLEWKKTQLALLQKQYDLAMSRVGFGVQQAQQLPDVEAVLSVKARENEEKAKERGSAAQRIQSTEKANAENKIAAPIRRKYLTRDIEDIRSALIVQSRDFQTLRQAGREVLLEMPLDANRQLSTNLTSSGNPGITLSAPHLRKSHATPRIPGISSQKRPPTIAASSVISQPKIKRAEPMSNTAFSEQSEGTTHRKYEDEKSISLGNLNTQEDPLNKAEQQLEPLTPVLNGSGGAASVENTTADVMQSPGNMLTAPYSKELVPIVDKNPHYYADDSAEDDDDLLERYVLTFQDKENDTVSHLDSKSLVDSILDVGARNPYGPLMGAKSGSGSIKDLDFFFGEYDKPNVQQFFLFHEAKKQQQELSNGHSSVGNTPSWNYHIANKKCEKPKYLEPTTKGRKFKQKVKPSEMLKEVERALEDVRKIRSEAELEEYEDFEDYEIADDGEEEEDTELVKVIVNVNCPGATVDVNNQKIKTIHDNERTGFSVHSEAEQKPQVKTAVKKAIAKAKVVENQTKLLAEADNDDSKTDAVSKVKPKENKAEGKKTPVEAVAVQEKKQTNETDVPSAPLAKIEEPQLKSPGKNLAAAASKVMEKKVEGKINVAGSQTEKNGAETKGKSIGKPKSLEKVESKTGISQLDDATAGKTDDKPMSKSTQGTPQKRSIQQQGKVKRASSADLQKNATLSVVQKKPSMPLVGEKSEVGESNNSTENIRLSNSSTPLKGKGCIENQKKSKVTCVHHYTSIVLKSDSKELSSDMDEYASCESSLYSMETNESASTTEKKKKSPKKKKEKKKTSDSSAWSSTVYLGPPDKKIIWNPKLDYYIRTLLGMAPLCCGETSCSCSNGNETSGKTSRSPAGDSFQISTPFSSKCSVASEGSFMQKNAGVSSASITSEKMLINEIMEKRRESDPFTCKHSIKPVIARRQRRERENKTLKSREESHFKPVFDHKEDGDSWNESSNISSSMAQQDLSQRPSEPSRISSWSPLSSKSSVVRQGKLIQSSKSVAELFAKDPSHKSTIRSINSSLLVEKPGLHNSPSPELLAVEHSPTNGLACDTPQPSGRLTAAMQKYQEDSDKCKSRINTIQLMLDKIRRDVGQMQRSTSDSCSSQIGSAYSEQRAQLIEEISPVPVSNSMVCDGSDTSTGMPDIVEDLMKRNLISSPFRWSRGQSSIDDIISLDHHDQSLVSPTKDLEEMLTNLGMDWARAVIHREAADVDSF